MSRIFIILSVLALVSCGQSVDLQLEPEVTVFFSDDSEQRVRLNSQDKEYAVLNEWLREHSADWLPTSGPYPGGVYVKSGDYGIQVTERHVVLYSTDHPEPRSMYIQKIDRGELSEIRDVGKTNNE